MLPDRIGRYEVLGQLAAGGMAEILLARISGPGDFSRAVVIKRILAGFAKSAAFVRMFLDEARIVASLRHPNIVQVQELGEDEGGPFLVMEYVAGENASSLLKRATASGEPLDPVLAAHLVAEACSGLHAAHESVRDDGRPQNLVHRDVSPQNVMVAYDGHVKLLDFGVALAEDRASRTEPGEVKGKFDYMSPEQMTGKALDRRTDLFALGAVLYELSTGRRLFKRASHARTIEAICREPVVPPSRVAATGVTYPPELERIVLRALAKDPNERFATAAELRSALLTVTRTLGDPAATLAAHMRRLFPDRIVEKEEMLRRVRVGDELSHVPPGETDEGVDVPNVPDATTVDGGGAFADDGARRRRRAWLAGGGALVAIAIAGTAWALASGRAPADDARVSRTEAPAEAASTAIVAPFDARLEVQTTPPGAAVSLDGEPLGATPLEVRLPRSGAARTLVVERAGHEALTQSLVVDGDLRLLFALKPAPAVPRPRATAKPPPTRRPASATKPAPPPSSSFHRFD